MTLGWIKEDAEEAFWAATEAVPQPYQASGRTCPFCAKHCADNQQLFAHLHSEHTRERPILLIRGEEPMTPHTLRYPLQPHDVAIENTETVFVRDSSGTSGAMAPSAATTVFARNSGFVDIELLGTKAKNESTLQSVYRIWFKAPTVAQYVSADRDFVEKFSQGSPKLADIDAVFSNHSNAITSEYVSALCDYVRGVLIKDRDPTTGVRPPYADYHLAYMRSLQILIDSPRPLSQLVAKTIRFALNDFSDVPLDSGFRHLDAAYEMLYHLAHVDNEQAVNFTEDQTLPKREIYPLDAGTSNVIELAYRFSTLPRWSPVDIQRAVDLASSGALSGYDRAKVLALWASTALRLSSIEAAKEPLGQLLSNDCFSAWAAAKLGIS